MDKRLIFFTLLLLILAWGCNSQEKNKEENSIDRHSVVAGQFYPNNKKELKTILNSYFEKAKKTISKDNTLAIISPHAGYVFSGQVAASAFNQLDARKHYENIFIIATSHQIRFEGASVYHIGDYITPLGKVEVNRELSENLTKEKYFTYRKDAHKAEHSLEVQLPFLQYHLKKEFQIVPIVIGTESKNVIKSIAKTLKPYFNKSNLFVFSTDFSHYPEFNDANTIDSITASAVLTKTPETLTKVLKQNERKHIKGLVTSMCGSPGILALLYMIENEDEVKINQIQYMNSGNSKAGGKDRVVGYWAISATGKIGGNGFVLTDSDKKALLKLARKTIEQYIEKGEVEELDSNYSDILQTKCGAFVTLHKHGNLRGCIGRFEPNLPLYKVVQKMAVSASAFDPRFSKVTTDEIKKLDIEISVLTPMKKIKSTDEIVMGKHGIYIMKNGRGGTFLPQVATETGWSKEEFLSHCAAQKAGLGPDGWKDADIFIYEALVFSENDFEKK